MPRARNPLAVQMVKGAIGPLTSALPLFALPLLGAAFLPSSQFAIWSILASISTVALSLDFGGPAYLASRLDPFNRARPFLAATAMTCLGTAAVAGVSLCAWIPFSHTAAGAAFSFGAGVGAICAISAGSALRSIVQLQAQVALFDRRFILRNSLLCAHSVVALIVALIALPHLRTAWALPIAWLAAGVSGVIVGSLVLVRRSDQTDQTWSIETSEIASGRTYAWTRTLANVLRGVLMQADRWVVGVVGGPAVLAAYEIAWRVAAMPRFLAENLTFILGLDAARVKAGSRDDIVARLNYSIRFSLVVLVVSSGAVAIFYWLLPLAGIDLIWPAFALLLISHGAMASVSSISFIGNGIGIPTIDLPYLSMSSAICVASAFASHFAGNIYVFIGGTSIGLVLGNLWFWRYGSKTIKVAISR